MEIYDKKNKQTNGDFNFINMDTLKNQLIKALQFLILKKNILLLLIFLI